MFCRSGTRHDWSNAAFILHRDSYQSMEFESDLSCTQEYKSFRSTVPLKQIVIDSDGLQVWKVYEAGPRGVRCPLVCLPPVIGTADCFYRQILSLTARGYRVITVEYPVYWSVVEWCEGFKRLLDLLDVDRAHILGASLGGFLAQKFAELTSNSPRVASLILCNSFIDTKIFNYSDTSSVFWMLPATLLKKMIIGRFPRKMMDSHIADSIDFMVERLECLNQSELASRLTLNCSPDYVQPQKVQVEVMLLDVFDESALSQSVKDEMSKCYPNARLAHLKTGGNFPFLARADEVNVYIQVHLRGFEGTHLSASDTGTPVER
ncbi:maspardin-like isoform X3 [Eriocheir sinensis]|uniref:maspardin-like isoform X3 n=2 Tax=Eriocheir sinensis TaxID=95602 RepID=UPI0021CAD89F|nr:maspardin-like isoform X3 [Eriocheir sinensis]